MYFKRFHQDDLLRETIINYVKSDSLPKHMVIISDSKHKTVSDKLKG